MKYVRFISRILVGFVFVFSGFVKAVDPLGSTYKFIDYFDAFHLSFLEPTALPLAVLLSTVELVLGIALVLGIRMRIASWALLVFMSFFTLLTFILAIYNPVSDCGCFGDAIILTNWETFYKNLIIMVFVLLIFFQREEYERTYKPLIEWGIVLIFAIASISFSAYCLSHLPMIDFRPYSVGTFIPEKMEIPEDAPQAEYKIILKYEKNGEIKEFSVENLPDSTWTWVETETIRVKEGYVPPIHDFSIESPRTAKNITGEVLQDEGYNFLLVGYDLEEASQENMEKIIELATYSKHQGYRFIGLTASLQDEISQFVQETEINFPFYNTDEITLKTIVRANPGLVLIKEGTIIGKWHYQDIPSVEELGEQPLAYQLNKLRNRKESLLVFGYVLAFFLFVMLFRIYKKYMLWLYQTRI